jgi:hypothetical protein
MEQVNVSDHAATRPVPIWVGMLWAVVATARLGDAILRRWRGFDATHEFCAVALLIALVLIPANAVWGRQGRRLDWSNLTPAYVLLLLATIVFD